MSKLFFKEHCTVFTFAGDSGIINYVGEGELKMERDKLTNDALMDDWEFISTGRRRATLDFELAADTTTVDIVDKFIEGGKYQFILKFVDGQNTRYRKGTFLITGASDVLSGAIRQRCTAESDGPITTVESSP